MNAAETAVSETDTLQEEADNQAPKQQSEAEFIAEAEEGSDKKHAPKKRVLKKRYRKQHAAEETPAKQESANATADAAAEGEKESPAEEPLKVLTENTGTEEETISEEVDAKPESIGDEEIAGDLVPSGTADLIISMEPMESLRYLNYLKPNGIVITASEPVKNISNYPDVNAVYAKIAEIPGSICLEAESLAEAAGSRRASNMVLIGAASSFLPLETDELQNAIRETFASKGESIVETNLKAFDAGRRFQNPD